jgi:hypothetical protein
LHPIRSDAATSSNPATASTAASRFSGAQWHQLQQQFKRFSESYCSSRFPFVVAKAHYYEIV